MTELWEILLPTPDDWREKRTASANHIGSVYLLYGRNERGELVSAPASEVSRAAKERFGRKALAYRRSGSEKWTMIAHERIY